MGESATLSGQKRMARLVRGDKKAAVTHITSLNNQCTQKNTSNPEADRLQQQENSRNVRPHFAQLTKVRKFKIGQILSRLMTVTSGWSEFGVNNMNPSSLG